LSLLRGECPQVTAGEQLWDYIFAADAAAAVALVSDHTQATGVFNLGSGSTATVRSIIEKVRNLIDPRLPVGFGEVPYRPDQVMHLEADISRLTALGWRPRVSLADGVARTVDWCREISAQRLAA
jgi:UDP-glucose 4-epimerase